MCYRFPHVSSYLMEIYSYDTFYIFVHFVNPTHGEKKRNP